MARLSCLLIYKCYIIAVSPPHNGEPVERPRGLGHFYVELRVPVVLDALDALDLEPLHIQQAAQHGQRITLRANAPPLPDIYVVPVARLLVGIEVARS